MFKGFTTTSVTLAAALLASTSASATTVVLSNTTSSWQNTVGGEDVSTVAGDPSRLYWGDVDRGDPQSSYKFDAINAGPQNVTATFLLPPNPSASQQLGTFTHYNNPIGSGSSITSTQLKITTNVSVDSTNLGPLSFVFTLNHNETPNVGGGNCCADIVTFSTSALSQNFSVGGTLYTLYLTGFGSNANNITTQFSSPEGGSTPVGLWGYVAAATPAVPEPATWAMMIGGLSLVGLSMRRRNTSVSFA